MSIIVCLFILFHLAITLSVRAFWFTSFDYDEIFLSNLSEFISEFTKTLPNLSEFTKTLPNISSPFDQSFTWLICPSVYEEVRDLTVWECNIIVGTLQDISRTTTIWSNKKSGRPSLPRSISFCKEIISICLHCRIHLAVRHIQGPSIFLWILRLCFISPVNTEWKLQYT